VSLKYLSHALKSSPRFGKMTMPETLRIFPKKAWHQKVTTSHRDHDPRIQEQDQANTSPALGYILIGPRAICKDVSNQWTGEFASNTCSIAPANSLPSRQNLPTPEHGTISQPAHPTTPSRPSAPFPPPNHSNFNHPPSAVSRPE
jgi:hypothetical protein